MSAESRKRRRAARKAARAVREGSPRSSGGTEKTGKGGADRDIGVPGVATVGDVLRAGRAAMRGVALMDFEARVQTLLHATPVGHWLRRAWLERTLRRLRGEEAGARVEVPPVIAGTLLVHWLGAARFSDEAARMMTGGMPEVEKADWWARAWRADLVIEARRSNKIRRMGMLDR